MPMLNDLSVKFGVLPEKNKKLVSAVLCCAVLCCAVLCDFTHFRDFVKSILAIFFCISYLTVNNIKCVLYKFFTDMPFSISDFLESIICFIFT